MLFSRKRNVEVGNLLVNNETIEWVHTHKHLGLVLHDKLNWKHHVNYIVDKANIILNQSKNMISKTWGIKPAYVRWLYIAIIRQVLSYGAVIWVNALKRAGNLKKLERIQRTICRYITGARRSMSLMGQQMFTNIRPIDLFLQESAINATSRLIDAGRWDREIFNVFSHVKYIEEFSDQHKIKIHQYRDKSQEAEYIKPKFKTYIGQRENIMVSIYNLDNNIVHIFTDGSKTEAGNTGAAFWIRGENLMDEGSCYLSSNSTVYQAEVYTIVVACQQLIVDRIRGKEIHFHR